MQWFSKSTYDNFAYDAAGQRTSKKSSKKENLYFDKMWSSTVSGSAGMEHKNIYLGKDRLLTKLGNGDKHNSTDNSYQKINQYYNHANHIGSVNVITDHKGKEFKYIEYTPYGEQWFSESTTDLGGSVGVSVLEHGYTDHLHDEETGLIYANARYLDPKTSRWLSGDPAMGEYLPLSPENKNAEEYNKNLPGMGGIYNSRNLQTYHYAGNNPIKYVDPSGKYAAYHQSPEMRADQLAKFQQIREHLASRDPRYQEKYNYQLTMNIRNGLNELLMYMGVGQSANGVAQMIKLGKYSLGGVVGILVGLGMIAIGAWNGKALEDLRSNDPNIRFAAIDRLTVGIAAYVQTEANATQNIAAATTERDTLIAEGHELGSDRVKNQQAIIDREQKRLDDAKNSREADQAELEKQLTPQDS
jgi:RHS repeat-associated protein